MLPVCLWLLIPLCCSRPSQGDGDVDNDDDDDDGDGDDDDDDDDEDHDVGEMHYCKLG